MSEFIFLASHHVTWSMKFCSPRLFSILNLGNTQVQTTNNGRIKNIRVKSEGKFTLGNELNSFKSQENEKMEVHFILYLYLNECTKFSWDLSQVWRFGSVNNVKKRKRENNINVGNGGEENTRATSTDFTPLFNCHS